MSSYSQLIETFMHQALPLSANPKVQFEAIVASIIGTKQRRFGPMPDPEVQVLIRDIVRQSGKNVTFYIPWGARKQADGQNIDILEFMALKQLACLYAELQAQGIDSTFRFRLENFGDRWLFGDGSLPHIDRYVSDFRKLASQFLPLSAQVHTEDMYTSYSEFHRLASEYAPVFLRFLNKTDREGDPLGVFAVESLRAIGWKGAIPQEQRDYYLSNYRQYWPEKSKDELLWELARYFASALARINTGSTAAPGGPFVGLTFGHPIPGDPIARARVHYRTIPQRFTNIHKSPWIGKGYFQIDEMNSVTPKAAGVHEALEFNKHILDFAGVTIEADYVLA